MRYNNERDVLIQRNDTESASADRPAAERTDGLWRVISPVAVRNPVHPWAVALEHARAHAKRTGGDVYRQVGNAAPERIEPVR